MNKKKNNKPLIIKVLFTFQWHYFYKLVTCKIIKPAITGYGCILQVHCNVNSSCIMACSIYHANNPWEGKTSVTKFGEILPLWNNVKALWPF